MFDESIKPGDTVWSLDANREFDIIIEQWIVEQINGPTSVSLIFVNTSEKRRAVKSTRVISKDKTRIVNYMIDSLNKQKSKYEANMQKLQSLLEENIVEIVTIQNTEEEI